MKIYRSLVWSLFVLMGAGVLPLAVPVATTVAAEEKADKKEDKSADDKNGSGKDDAKKDDKDKKDDEDKEDDEDKVVATEHTATIQGKELKYTATAGKLVMKSDDGKTKAHIFFIAYTKNGVEDLAGDRAGGRSRLHSMAGRGRRRCGCTWACSGRSG